ncbi:MAG: hypothetical protein R2750_09525 [Bacteroidales bacterium]
MKHKFQIFTVLLALICATSAVDAQQKYALLIGETTIQDQKFP